MEIRHTRKRGSMMDNLQLDKLKNPTFYEATGFLDDDYTGTYLRGSIGNDYYQLRYTGKTVNFYDSGSEQYAHRRLVSVSFYYFQNSNYYKCYNRGSKYGEQDRAPIPKCCIFTILAYCYYKKYSQNY